MTSFFLLFIRIIQYRPAECLNKKYSDKRPYTVDSHILYRRCTGIHKRLMILIQPCKSHTDNSRKKHQPDSSTIAEGNLVKLAEADVAFHEVIYQASDNKRLIQVLNNMREQIYRYRVEYLKEGETRDVLVKEHEELTKAIRERDVERAKQLSFQHIENQRMAIMRSIEAEDAERERAEKEKSRGHR